MLTISQIFLTKNNNNKFMGSNHQTTNSKSTTFLPNVYYDFFATGKLKKNLFWTIKKYVFFFNCSSWEKFVDETVENKIRCLVVWSHELITRLEICQNLKFVRWKNVVNTSLYLKKLNPSWYTSFHISTINKLKL